ncbi:hypothetical protein AX16_003017 [Volvariella volvacea WC 439]|nr:hypothetical protein AX16_003017 [Volvariella volvacea WC 439]
MSGCAICVYDLYEESMISYKESVAALQVSLEKLKIPESEWPQHIQRNIRLEAKNTSTPNGAAKSVTLSAFEELERRLQEKQNGGDAQATHSIHQEAIKSANRRGKGAPTIDTVKEVYEGLQWVLLSNR